MASKTEGWVICIKEVLRVIVLILEAYTEAVAVYRQLSCFMQFPSPGRVK